MHQASKQSKLRVRVERGIFNPSTREGETRYDVSYLDSDGRQRWCTASTLTDARRLRAGLVTRVSSGERVAPSKVTLEEFAADWGCTRRGDYVKSERGGIGQLAAILREPTEANRQPPWHALEGCR
jgi:hypothetical protein